MTAAGGGDARHGTAQRGGARRGGWRRGAAGSAVPPPRRTPRRPTGKF